MIHIVARSLHGFEPFKLRNQSVWIWNKIAKNFPNIYAAVLMPNHLHLIVKTDSTSRERLKISGIASRFSRVFYSTQKIWEPVPEPEIIPDRFHLQRQIRYVHLNPCRKKLVDDPLKWEFSTHRDWLGLSYSPLVRDDIRKSVFQTFNIARFHSYVSSDPSCKVDGTPLPSSLTKTTPIEVNHRTASLNCIFKSVLISQHQTTEALKNRSLARVTAIHIAAESKEFYPTLLAKELGCARQSIYKILKRPKNLMAINAAKHILSDQRLLFSSLKATELSP